MINLAQAYHAKTPEEVQFRGTVTSAPHDFFGTHTKEEHEEFNVRTTAGPLNVVDNIEIGKSVPVIPGDRVEVRGEMVHDPGREPCVHFVHHDPQGTHPDGFIRLDGVTYS